MSLKILIAEDNESIAKAYKLAFENRGHKVSVTKNGQECIRRYKEDLPVEKTKNSFPFDVVIVDQAMPIKDGATLVGEILDLRPKQRIIFASAHMDDVIKNMEKFRRSVEFFQKPFHLENLVHAVETTIHKIPKPPLGSDGFRIWDESELAQTAGPGPTKGPGHDRKDYRKYDGNF